MPMIDPNGGLPALSEQQLAELFGPQAVAQKRKDLAAQQAKIDALRGSSMAQGHKSAIGTGLAGIGDMLNAWKGRKLAQTQDANMAALPGQEQNARAKAYQMIQLLRQQEPDAQSVQAPQMLR